MAHQLLIPEYPAFIPFDFEHKEDYEKIYNKYEPYSEFYFANLAVWLNLNNDLEISKLNNNLIIRFSTVDKPNQLLYGIYGNNLIDETFNKILLQKQPKGIYPTKIDIVPEFTINALKNKNKFDVFEDRDNWEYIYSATDQSQLNNKKFANNRYKLNKFLHDHGSDIKIEEHWLNTAISPKLSSFLNKNISKNDQNNHEKIALTNAFKYGAQLNSKIMLLYINKQISGFVIYYLLNKKYAQIGHIKVDYKFLNIFNFLFHELATDLNSKSVKYINLEQDLGIGGLRTHKTEMRPYKFLKKYTISLKK